MNDTATLGIIGGSGLYDMPGLQDARDLSVDTPFGKTSAPIVAGTLEGTRVAFLARHGLGHHITPTEVPYRANIYALKSLGVERIVSVSACGSLKEELAPGHVVIPDQIYDNTHGRARSFFDEGLVAHVSVADPFCRDLSTQLESAVSNAGGVVHRGGAFIPIEGPRFSTKAESSTYRLGIRHVQLEPRTAQAISLLQVYRGLLIRPRHSNINVRCRGRGYIRTSTKNKTRDQQ